MDLKIFLLHFFYIGLFTLLGFVIGRYYEKVLKKIKVLLKLNKKEEIID